VSLPRCLLPPWGPASPPVGPLTLRCCLSGSEPEVRAAVPFRASLRGPEQHPPSYQILESSLLCEAPWGRYDVPLIRKGCTSGSSFSPPWPVHPRNSVFRPQPRPFLACQISSPTFLSASQPVLYHLLSHIPALSSGLRLSGLRPSDLRPPSGPHTTILRSSSGPCPTFSRPPSGLWPTFSWPIPGLRPSVS
jgi:hypothetical protein